MKKEVPYFIKLSTTIGPSIMDWLRSIYFSLVGSSVLALVLKVTTYDWCTTVLYVLADALLIVGLVWSVKIVKRFKDYEKSWPEDIPDPNEKHFDEYCADHESSQHYQHLGLYTFWFAALICLGIVGYRIERSSSQNQAKNKEEFTKVEHMIDSLQRLTPALQQLNTGMNTLLRRSEKPLPKPKQDKQPKNSSHVH